MAQGIAKRINTFLGAGFFFIAARAAKGGVKFAFGEGIEERLRFQQAATFLGAEREGISSSIEGFLVLVDD